jgi:hypothetical protein
MTTRPTCETCPFWGRPMANSHPPGIGACHLEPIVIPTKGSHWCGKHPNFYEYLAAWRLANPPPQEKP